MSLAATFGLIESQAPDVPRLLLEQYLLSDSPSRRCIILKTWRDNPRLAPIRLQQLILNDPAWTQLISEGLLAEQVTWFQADKKAERGPSILTRTCSRPRRSNLLLKGIQVALPLPPQ